MQGIPKDNGITIPQLNHNVTMKHRSMISMTFDSPSLGKNCGDHPDGMVCFRKAMSSSILAQVVLVAEINYIVTCCHYI